MPHSSHNVSFMPINATAQIKLPSFNRTISVECIVGLSLLGIYHFLTANYFSS